MGRSMLLFPQLKVRVVTVHSVIGMGGASNKVPVIPHSSVNEYILNLTTCNCDVKIYIYYDGTGLCVVRVAEDDCGLNPETLLFYYKTLESTNHFLKKYFLRDGFRGEREIVEGDRTTER